jgi:CubicO group peptidase (beta-lactamase class C family)
MKRIRRLLCAVVLIVSARYIHASSEDASNLDRVFDRLESNNRVQGSVAIAEGGKVVYSRAVGLRDAGKKNDVATMFRVGSVTKVFTAAMIYQLIDEKKLTLETPLSKFFPQIANAKQITIAHLLAHTSGLPNFPTADDYAKGWIFQPQTKTAMLARFASLTPDFTPGERVSYSNTGYVLLGYVIESVTRSTYDRQLQKRIVKPLGLRRTRFGGTIDTAKNEARSHDFDDGKWIAHKQESLSVSAGAGAIVSTAEDLARFITAVFDGRLISANSVREMITPFSPQFEGGERKGVVVSKLARGADKTIYSHLGGIDAFSANLVYFPETKTAIAIAMNGQNFPMNRLFWLLADSRLGLPSQPLSFEGIALPEQTLLTYEGVYTFPQIGMDITVRRDGEQLTAQATDQQPFAITAFAPPSDRFDALFWDRSGIVIEFRRDPDGDVSSIVLFQGKSELRFKRKGEVTAPR